MKFNAGILNVLAALFGFVASSSHPGALQEYCLMDTFRPRCTHGDVISMTTAMFGRMRVGRCITANDFQLLQHPDSLGCSADVLEYFDRVCSGRSSCDVVIPNPDLFNYRPCSAQLSMYLEAAYKCVSVIDDDRSCSLSASVGSTIFIPSSPKTQSSSIRGSPVAEQCGSRSNPWIVEAQTGQKINISLLDFGPRKQRSMENTDKADAFRGENNTVCAVHYGYAVDKSAAATKTKNVPICGNDNILNQRERLIYQSKGSSVEIVLLNQDNGDDGKQNKFLLGIEAVGCSNLVPPVDTWLKRTDNEATVGCYTTRQRWHLRCEDGQWKGTIGQCIDTEHDSMEHVVVASVAKPETTTFFNLLATVAVSFAGVAICLIIIFVGIGCANRYRRQLLEFKTDTVKSHKQSHVQVQQIAMNSGGYKDNTAVRPVDHRQHQYFVLDKDFTSNETELGSGQ